MNDIENGLMAIIMQRATRAYSYDADVCHERWGRRKV